MAILPGSLDYLYHYGILPRIPYEAYEMTPMTPSGQAQLAGLGMGQFSMDGVSGLSYINGSQYLNQAQTGMMYNTYTNPDTFVRRNNQPTNTADAYSISRAFTDGVGYGKDFDVDTSAWGQDTKGVRKVFSEGVSKVKDSVVNSPVWLKGLVSGGIILGTLACILKGKKYPVPQASEPNIFQKLVSKFKK